MTARQRLREGLAPLHARLDARITGACLSPRADLRRLLAVHARAFPPVVAGLRAAGAERLWPGWDGPARLAALSAEAGPGAAPDGGGGGATPPERFRNEHMAWGGLYALLGSRLGNKVVLRRLAEGGEPSDSGFLRPGAEDGPEWRRFLDRLDAVSGPSEGACRDVIEGAALVMRRYLDAAARLGGRPARIEGSSR